MNNPLGLACGPGGVEDEQRILGVHLDRACAVVGFGMHLRIVEVAALDPGRLRSGALDHQKLAVMRGMAQCLVAIGLERGRASAARRMVGGDHQLGVAAVDACRKRVGRETGENDGMNGADPRAGQHRVGGLGDHRQVDDHPVALANAQFLEDVRHLAHFAVQLAIGDVLRCLCGIVGLPDDRGLVAAGRQMAVNAIGADVQRAILEPFDVDRTECVIGGLDLGEGRDPVEPLGLFAPEAFRVRDGSRVHPVVGVRIYVRTGDEVGARRIGGRLRRLAGHGVLPSVTCYRSPTRRFAQCATGWPHPDARIPCGEKHGITPQER